MNKTIIGDFVFIAYIVAFLWLFWYKIGGFVLSRTKGVLVPFLWFVVSAFCAFIFMKVRIVPYLKANGYIRSTVTFK